MSAVLMESSPVVRSSSARRSTVRPKRSVVSPSPSRFASCLRRFSAAGLRLVITAPSDSRMLGRALRSFPGRAVDPSSHFQWDTAYRAFSGRSREPQDHGSWRILAVTRDDRVVGAITARFFGEEFVPEYLHLLTLLDTTGPVFREHCELAVAEVIAHCARARRVPAEISHWAVAPIWHAALVSVTLMQAMAALAAAFGAPHVLMAADNRRGEVARMMRLGAEPLGLAGRSCLPPFVHHASGAWLRLLLIDASTFQRRAGCRPTSDLALLRSRATVVSVA